MATDMAALASSIAKDTAILDDYFKAKGLSSPSFVDGPDAITISPAEHPDVAAAHERVIAATRDLHALVLGPKASLKALVAHNNVFTLQAIDNFNIAECVPLDGEASFVNVASKCGLSLPVTSRVLRYAMTNHVFREPRPGMVAHTAASKLLAEDAITRGIVSMTSNECAAASLKTNQVFKKYPGSEDPLISGWGLFNNAKAPMFEELAQHYPERAKVMRRMMDFMASIVPTQPLNDNYPWASLGNGLVVDMGGSHGPVCIALARQFPDLRFIVQDLAGPATEGRKRLPAELADRITFMEHDFLTPQPVKDADVYFFRATLHNWPDKQCIAVLRALIPALKQGASVVVNDTCLPEPGALGAWADRQKREIDLDMMHLFNARDREEGEWERLFTEADPRFKFQGVRAPVINKTGMPTSSLMSIIEAKWMP